MVGLKENTVNNFNNYIYIPFNNFTSIGGPSTFMYNLRVYLDSINYKYHAVPMDDISIFFPIIFNIPALEQIKNSGGYVIQRLDGIYYPSKHGNKHIELNSEIKKIYLKYTDHVVFQSNYSKKQCFEMLGVKDQQNYSIIINGVNKEIFIPDNRESASEIIEFITTGNFRNIDMIEPVVAALDSLAGKFDFRLNIIGPIVNESLKGLLQRDYVVTHGSKTIYEIAEILPKMDIFIYSHLNPPCPNSVLEAISCGLPVVGFDSGSMNELCWFSKDLLAYVSDDTFQKYEDFNPEALAEKIELCIDNYSYYRKLALDHSYLYSFEECGKKYVEVFDRVINNGGRDISVLKKRNIVKIYLKDKVDSIRKILISRLSDDNFREMVFDEINVRINRLNPEDALKFLFDIDNRLYEIEGQASIRYGNGLHTKHKHIKYHDFFINNIETASRVLDVGCGNGALASDIADNVENVFVYAIDIVKQNIEIALSGYNRTNIKYVCGDALTDLPNEHFNVIVLSNVLEHIEGRGEFLSSLNEKYTPDKLLIRVPSFDRDWRVPLKKEIGMDYMLDKTHFIEYLYPEFEVEINDAGLFIEGAKINWGEIWAVVKRNNNSELTGV